ncbi:hypothetical protein Tco_1407904 [Tanacetum coccineum]
MGSGPMEARNHLPPKESLGRENRDEWNNLVDWKEYTKVQKKEETVINEGPNRLGGRRNFEAGDGGLDMKSMHRIRLERRHPVKTDQDILDEVVPSTNRQNMSGKGRKLPGGGSTSRRRGPQAFPDVISREEMDRILRQENQDGRFCYGSKPRRRKQRAYLVNWKADEAYQNSETMYGA